MLRRFYDPEDVPTPAELAEIEAEAREDHERYVAALPADYRVEFDPSDPDRFPF